MNFTPNSLHTTPVVPVPINGSQTMRWALSEFPSDRNRPKISSWTMFKTNHSIILSWVHLLLIRSSDFCSGPRIAPLSLTQQSCSNEIKLNKTIGFNNNSYLTSARFGFVDSRTFLNGSAFALSALLFMCCQPPLEKNNAMSVWLVKKSTRCLVGSVFL